MQSPLAPSFLQKSLEIETELNHFKDRISAELPDLPAPIGRLVQHIHENLFDMELNVSSAKASCRTRNNNVTTLFKTCLGVGIREYIEAARIDAACALLRYPHHESYLVAMAVGYCHPETFHRAFLRRKGVTPADYQTKMNRQEVIQEKPQEDMSVKVSA